MAILSGQEILKQIESKHIRLSKFDVGKVQVNSYDITINNKIYFYALTDYIVQIGQVSKEAVFENYGMVAIENPNDAKNCGYIRSIPYLDSRKENSILTKTIPDTGYILLPRILYIIESDESVWSDNYIFEIVESPELIKLGVTIKQISHYSRPNEIAKLKFTVEVIHPIKIYAGMKIGQMYFHSII